ncbi:MAG: hypothetical protein MUF29_00160 [Chitinophagaceae bacterium]|jgi:hypothetical protein|nr:hypothetical protein [Chitinophagaceae bacterium]
MKGFSFLLPVTLLLVACTKQPPVIPPPVITPQPAMHVIQYQNKVVRYAGAPALLDVDADGSLDFVFGVQLVGDPLLQADKVQFLAKSNVDRLLAVNAREETPSLAKGSLITAGALPGHAWYDIASIVLVQKTLRNDADPVWDGNWRKEGIQYLPVQLLKAGQRFNGWIALQFNQQSESLVVLSSAISREPEKTVQAGN